jgi:hypothetical protein
MDQEMDFVARPMGNDQSAGADLKPSAECSSDAERNISVASDGGKRSRLQMFAIVTALFVRLSLSRSHPKAYLQDQTMYVVFLT